MIIASLADVATGVAHVCSVDPAMARAHAEAGMPPLRRSAPGLPSLIDIIIGQQVSVASAKAIAGRFAVEFPDPAAEELASAEDARFRSAGLSRPKINALRAVGAAILGGRLPLETLAEMPADDARGRLLAIKGIGPWTADLYLMFALGHADAFAPGDLALQEAMRLIDGLAQRPDAKALAGRAALWRPWRAAGARMLWHYYRHVKLRDGVQAGL